MCRLLSFPKLFLPNASPVGVLVVQGCPRLLAWMPCRVKHSYPPPCHLSSLQTPVALCREKSALGRRGVSEQQWPHQLAVHFRHSTLIALWTGSPGFRWTRLHLTQSGRTEYDQRKHSLQKPKTNSSHVKQPQQKEEKKKAKQRQTTTHRRRTAG